MEIQVSAIETLEKMALTVSKSASRLKDRGSYFQDLLRLLPRFC